MSFEFDDALTAPQIEEMIADIEHRIHDAHPEVTSLFIKPQNPQQYTRTVREKFGENVAEATRDADAGQADAGPRRTRERKKSSRRREHSRRSHATSPLLSSLPRVARRTRPPATGDVTCNRPRCRSRCRARPPPPRPPPSACSSAGAPPNTRSRCARPRRSMRPCAPPAMGSCRSASSAPAPGATCRWPARLPRRGRPARLRGHARARRRGPAAGLRRRRARRTRLPRIDVAFPALHGPFGEDGCLQGLFETCGVPYVGAGVLAGAVDDGQGGDQAAADAGRPAGRAVSPAPPRQARAHLAGVSDSLGPRLYVKPASLGSSIGTAPADDEASFARALAGALEHGDKVLVERRVDRPRARMRRDGDRGRPGGLGRRRDRGRHRARVLRLRRQVRGRQPARRSTCRRAWTPRRRAASARWPSKPSRCWAAATWRASTSSSASRASCSSTRSTRCPGSRRSACFRACSRPRASDRGPGDAPGRPGAGAGEPRYQHTWVVILRAG